MKVQYSFKFLPTPKEYKGRAILQAVDQNALEALRALVKGSEKKEYIAEVTVSDVRSLPANARFHVILGRYASQVGLSIEDTKMQIKHAYGQAIPYCEGFVPPLREGCFVEIYGAIEYQVSTAVYTKSEMQKLMDGLDFCCAEAGIVV